MSAIDTDCLAVMGTTLSDADSVANRRIRRLASEPRSRKPVPNASKAIDDGSGTMVNVASPEKVPCDMSKLPELPVIKASHKTFKETLSTSFVVAGTKSKVVEPLSIPFTGGCPPTIVRSKIMAGGPRSKLSDVNRMVPDDVPTNPDVGAAACPL